MGLASVGGAQAQALPALQDTLGANLLALQSQFGNGNWVNEAVNIGAINGAVTLGQAGAESITNIDLPTVDLNVQAALGAGLTVIPPTAAIAGAGEVDLAVNLGQIDQTVRTIGGIASSDEISTTVLGAVNTGDIASVGSATAVRATNQTTIATGSTFTSVTAASEAAARTSNTASSAAASQELVAAVTGPTTTVTNSVESLYNGPLQDVYANNRAFNVGAINGAVTGIANNMDLAGISTTVLGAVNTGTISMGYSGAAFNAAQAATNAVTNQVTGQ
jgi:hypothetical protein